MWQTLSQLQTTIFSDDVKFPRSSRIAVRVENSLVAHANEQTHEMKNGREQAAKTYEKR